MAIPIHLTLCIAVAAMGGVSAHSRRGLCLSPTKMLQSWVLLFCDKYIHRECICSCWCMAGVIHIHAQRALLAAHEIAAIHKLPATVSESDRVEEQVEVRGRNPAAAEATNRTSQSFRTMVHMDDCFITSREYTAARKEIRYRVPGGGRFLSFEERLD
jgi:hypothetical protein